MPPFCLFKCLCNLFELLDYLYVLRAVALALTTFDTFGGLAVFCAYFGIAASVVVVEVSEVFRDGNVHRAAFSTVMAGSARHCDLAVDDVSYPEADIFFLICKRLEVRHVAQVVLHLIQVAHA